MKNGNGKPTPTATQRRMLKVLSDGMRHSRAELVACLYDDLARREAIQGHISAIRAIIRPLGQDIICEYHGRSIHYRHVRLLQSADDGLS